MATTMNENEVGGDDIIVKVTPETKEVIKKSQKDLETFSELLDSISTVDNKLKLLWRQIYENALQDRINSYLIWMDLYMIVIGNKENHVIHGDHMARYLERMEKANAQLLKLAELVSKAKEQDESSQIPNASKIFDRLERKLKP